MTREHLGDRLAALVDGELDHVARDRALSHLSQCASCREEAEAQRRVKAALAQRDAGYVPPAVVELLAGLKPPPSPPSPWPALSALAPVEPFQTSFPDPEAAWEHAAASLRPDPQDGPVRHVRPIPHPWRARRILAAASFTAAVGAVAATGIGVGSSDARTAPTPQPSSTAVVYTQQPEAAGRELLPADPMLLDDQAVVLATGRS